MWDQVDTARRNIEEETRPWAEAIFDGDDYAESAPFVLHLERFCREIIAGYRNETTEWSPLDHDYFFTLCIIALAHGSAYPEIRIPATWLLPDGSMISRPKNSATTIY